MVIKDRLYTAEDLWELSHLPENSEKRFELAQGVLIEMSPAGGEHGLCAAALLANVWNFVNQHKLGYVTAAETGYILFANPDGRNTVRAPDVGFVAAARLLEGFPQGYIPLAPDLAIEVVSLNDKAVEIADKINDYLRAGIPLIWFFYPKLKTVQVYAQSKVEVFGIDDSLDGGNVLPGFKLPLMDIFES